VLFLVWVLLGAPNLYTTTLLYIHYNLQRFLSLCNPLLYCLLLVCLKFIGILQLSTFTAAVPALPAGSAQPA
jgi:hypothetical protein